MNTTSNVAQLRRPHNESDTSPQMVRSGPGGKRWGYPLKFKMDAIRMVREQGMSIGQVHRKLDIAKNTLQRWLDFYDLKRIPPKGGNEYPRNQALQPDTPRNQSAPAQPTERKDQIRDAIGLLKQAVDLLYTACQPKQAA